MRSPSKNRYRARRRKTEKYKVYMRAYLKNYRAKQKKLKRKK
jgi:hypothetical protein